MFCVIYSAEGFCVHRDFVAVSFYNSVASSGSYCDSLSCNIELDCGKIREESRRWVSQVEV